MNVFYLDEHIRCSNYLSDIHNGFKYMEVKKGMVLNVKNKQDKHLFFFLSGRIRVRCNEFLGREFGAGEMIFLPKSADSQGDVLEDTTFIILTYDESIHLCDRVSLQPIIKASKQIVYDFNSLPICPIVWQYLDLLSVYLQDGINCFHLHEIKKKEIFLLFMVYYKTEELANFFYPMLGQSLDFRSKVMEHYLTVKTAEELAGICGYSVRRFNELFTAEFGDSPYNWILKQKSKHIIGKLALENVCFKDIIVEFGFSDASHFTRYCLKQFGKTPMQLRKRFCLKNQ